MNFYANTCNRNSNLTIRVHPVLLSLVKTINASETNPDISTISKNDKRALRSIYYMLPGALLPLEIHFSGQNGPSLLSNHNGHALTSVADCRECMESAPQDNQGGDGNATQGNLAPTSHILEDNLTHMGSASLGMLNRGNSGKKHRCTSSGGLQGNLPNAHGPKVAGVVRRARGKQAQKERFTGC